MNEEPKRVLETAQLLMYQGRYNPTGHGGERMELRDISDDDVEAAIQSPDARVTEYRHENDTYTILGRRANGDMIKVVVAFNSNQLADATRLRIVSVMEPEQGDV